MSEKGGCLCGQYSYAFPREAVVSSHHCHCTDCQKMTGSGKATIIMSRRPASTGELKTYTVTGTTGQCVLSHLWLSGVELPRGHGRAEVHQGRHP